MSSSSKLQVAALSLFLSLFAMSNVAKADVHAGFCAAIMPCGKAPAFEVLPEFRADTLCGGPKGIYELRCANLRLAFENQTLKESLKHHNRSDRSRKHQKRK
jgi:hypothetical protein